jgi:hypothetical protein
MIQRVPAAQGSLNIDVEALEAFRVKFAVWRDADSFVITKD